MLGARFGRTGTGALSINLLLCADILLMTARLPRSGVTLSGCQDAKLQLPTTLCHCLPGCLFSCFYIYLKLNSDLENAALNWPTACVVCLFAFSSDKGSSNKPIAWLISASIKAVLTRRLLVCFQLE